MLQKFRSVIPGIALLAVSLTTASLAGAQAVSLQEQLAAQYKLSKLGNDSTGTSVIDEGTVLTIQKGGIMGLPYKSMITPTDTIQPDGTVHASNAQTGITGKGAGVKDKFCKFSNKCGAADNAKDSAAGNETSTKYFKKGDQVYVTKINVQPDKDTVTLSIVACETCNQGDKKADNQADQPAPTYNKANVVFQFAKGAVATVSAGQVEDTIGQLLAIKSDDAEKSQGGDQQQAAQGGGDQAAQQPAAQDQPAADPVNIEKGMTVDQVETAMGKPEKKVTLGNKVIYYYKDMKVIFLSGKVSDVQ